MFNDVERLCNTYVPRWLASDGMSEAKIAEFYDDTAKKACDAFSVNKAFYLRDLSVETGLLWRARRSGRFLAHPLHGCMATNAGSAAAGPAANGPRHQIDPVRGLSNFLVWLSQGRSHRAR